VSNAKHMKAILNKCRHYFYFVFWTHISAWQLLLVRPVMSCHAISPSSWTDQCHPASLVTYSVH